VSLAVAAIVAACPFVFTFVGLAMSENALVPATLLAAALAARWRTQLGIRPVIRIGASIPRALYSKRK